MSKIGKSIETETLMVARGMGNESDLLMGTFLLMVMNMF